MDIRVLRPLAEVCHVAIGEGIYGWHYECEVMGKKLYRLQDVMLAGGVKAALAPCGNLSNVEEKVRWGGISQ